MALSRRGKVAVAVSSVVVLAAGTVGVLAATGNADKVPGLGAIVHQGEPCPLTGLEPQSGSVPDRPARRTARAKPA